MSKSTQCLCQQEPLTVFNNLWPDVEAEAAFGCGKSRKHTYKKRQGLSLNHGRDIFPEAATGGRQLIVPSLAIRGGSAA